MVASTEYNLQVLLTIKNLSLTRNYLHVEENLVDILSRMELIVIW